jgi:hypothetical protein
VTQNLPQFMLGEFMSREALAPLVHNRLFKKGRWVPALRFRVEAGLWVFQTGVVLGAQYQNNLEVLAKCFATSGNERESIEYLRTRAAAMLDEIHAHGGTFSGLWSSMALDGADFNDVAIAAHRDKEQMRLGDAMDLCNRCMLDGIGFGGTFSEQAIEIWRSSHDVTEEDVSTAERFGLPTPESLGWSDVKLGVMEDFSEYITEFFPTLMEPLTCPR